MARPRQFPDEEILSAAREVFLEHGASASTTLVADKCGMSQAALFKRFGTKRELFLTAMRPPLPPFLPTLLAGPTEAPLDEQLFDIGMAITAFFRAAVPLMRVLMASGCDPHALFEGDREPPPIIMRRAMTQWFTAAADRLGDHDPEHLATAFLGALHVRTFMEEFLDSPTEPEPYVRTLVSGWLHGISA